MTLELVEDLLSDGCDSFSAFIKIVMVTMIEDNNFTGDDYDDNNIFYSS